MRAGIGKGNFGLQWDLPSAVICVSKPPHRLDFISASTTKTTSWANLQDTHLQNLTARVLSAKTSIGRVRSYAARLHGPQREFLPSAGEKQGEAFGSSATWRQQGRLLASAAGPALGPRRPPPGAGRGGGARAGPPRRCCRGSGRRP